MKNKLENYGSYNCIFFGDEESTYGTYPLLAKRRVCVGLAQRLTMTTLKIPTKPPRVSLEPWWK
jgi:hypothetical protein